jgi:hypothetical protein
MDRPAMVATAVLGVILIAVSAPFLGSIGGSGGNAYAITWTESESGSSQAPTGTAGSVTTIRVPVNDAQPSNATIALESCTDAAQAPLSQPATISWSLFEGDEELDSGTASCANQGPFTVALGSHADVGVVTAASPSAAEREAYAAGDNETTEFRLEVTWTRPAGASPLPLPLPNPAFAAVVSLTVDEWTATANTPDQEAPR